MINQDSLINYKASNEFDSFFNQVSYALYLCHVDVITPRPLEDQWLVLNSFILVGEINLLPNQGKFFQSHKITRSEVSTTGFQMNTSRNVNLNIKIKMHCVVL